MTRRSPSFLPSQRSVATQPTPPAPSVADILLEMAVAHHRDGELHVAEAIYRRILQLSPDHPGALHLSGLMAHRLGRHAAALELLDKAIAVDPRNPRLHIDRGNALYGLGRFQAALEGYDEALRLKPDYAEACRNRGTALYSLQQYQRALESFDKAIRLKPDCAEAHNDRGGALCNLQRHRAAVESFDQAIRLKPDYADAYRNRGTALSVLRQYQGAVASFDEAIRLKPDCAEAHCSRGAALEGLRQCQRAVESYDAAIRLRPDYAEAYCGRGSALHSLQQYQAALESQDQAIRLKPDLAEAHGNRGNALYALHRHQEALESYGEAIRRKPESAEAYKNRGSVFRTLRRHREALESFEKALALKPDFPYLSGSRIYTQRHLCEWEDLESRLERLEKGVDGNERVSPPFEFLLMSGSPMLQKKAAEIFARDHYPRRAAGASLPPHAKNGRIRVGYFSGDFYNHATCYLLAELFERHDRSRFEILGFSFGRDIKDEMTERVSKAMDRFLDVRSMPDADAARLARELGVDIAVDLKGWTGDHRMGIFAQRAAPVQASYLGYPGTTGADFMDYLIADPTLIPEASRQHYSEKIVYLPDSYQANDSKRPISATPRTRAEEGLPEQGFVYCCFNNNYKITPGVFDGWARILARVEGSVLWLLGDNRRAAENLRKELARRGVSAERLIFAKRLPLAEHLARHSLADLFLDTLPCNAHTTASDALWAGLPVLTRMGETFAGRVAASLLRAIDLPDLITASDSAYEAMAVELALRPEPLCAIRARLRRNRLASPLFDIRSYAKHLEAAYAAMHERSLAGFDPGHLHIARDADSAGGVTAEVAGS